MSSYEERDSYMKTWCKKKQKKMMVVLASVFANKSGFQNYIPGLIGAAEGKNGWQLRE
jgi:hypothetical protein